jgi:hypothetical protein
MGTTMRRREMEKVEAILHAVSDGRGDATTHLPVEFDVKPSNCKLERVKVFERVECQSSYRGRVCERPQKSRQSFGHVFVGTVSINSDGQVLLWIAEER